MIKSESGEVVYIYKVSNVCYIKVIVKTKVLRFDDPNCNSNRTSKLT